MLTLDQHRGNAGWHFMWVLWLNEAESFKTKEADICKTCWCKQRRCFTDCILKNHLLGTNYVCDDVSVHVAPLIHRSWGEVVQVHSLKFEYWEKQNRIIQELAGVWLAWLALFSRSCRGTTVWLSFSLLGYEPLLFLAVEASLGMGPTHSSSSPSPPSPWSSSAFRLSCTLFSDSAITADLPCGPFWITVLPFNACTSEFSPSGFNSYSLISGLNIEKPIKYLQRQFLWGVCFRLVIR